MNHCWMESVQPSTCQRVGAVRRQFLAWLDPLGLSEQLVEEAAVALSEACANAVQHGSPHGQLDSFHVRCDARGRNLVLEVTDCGPGFLFLGVSRPDPLALEEHGRGIWLMALLTDAIEFHHERGGMQVHMEKVMSDDFELRRALPPETIFTLSQENSRPRTRTAEGQSHRR